MDITLNWRQVVMISTIICGGFFAAIVAATFQPDAFTYEVCAAGLVVFLALNAWPISSRLREVARSDDPDQWPAQRRRVLRQIGWGYARIVVIALASFALAKFFSFKLWNEEYVLLPGFGAILFAFTPIIKALGR